MSKNYEEKVVKVGDISIGGNNPTVLIAGPCAIESEEKTLRIARELRIMVDNTKVNDGDAKGLAKEIALKIEQELRYPGRIKVTIIRETRIIEYAR